MTVFGEAHGRAILRSDEVREIREMSRKGTWSLREIGEIFNVSKATVADIKHGRTWRHLWQSDELPNSIPAVSSTAIVEQVE
jgi:hypothetical protein